MREQDYDVKFMSTFIKIVAIAFKWVCLINCVLCAGFSIGLLVMYMVKGNDLPITMLSAMVSSITKFGVQEVSGLVDNFGIAKLLVATLGYGFAVCVYYGCLHSLITKFLKIFESIIDGDMFNKENVAIINSTVLQSIIIAFVIPLTICCVSSSTGILSLSDINISGILYIFAVYIAKLVFTSGYELKLANNKKSREITEIKAEYTEEKIKMIKETTKKSSMKNPSTKKTTAKKPTTKKVAKKTTSK